MADPSLDPTGITILDVNELRQNYRDKVAANPNFGASVSTNPESRMGGIIDVSAEELSLVYSLIQAVYNQLDLDNAEGLQLDNLGGILGVIREPATKSVGTITASGTPATAIGLGSEVRVPDAGRFVTTVADVIGGGGTVDIPVEAVELGPIVGNAGTITEIVTSIPGWTGVTNATDVNLGQSEETDDQYRARIRRSRQISGTGTDAAIRARVEQLDFIDFVAAVSNRGIDPDVTGQPGKSVQVYVWPDTISPDQKSEVAQVIFGDAGLVAGIESFGTEAFLVEDNQGNDVDVAFSFADEQEIHFEVVILATGVGFPSNAEDIAKDTIIAYFDANQGTGVDVQPLLISCDILDAIPGILNMQLRLKVGIAPGGSDTGPITIDKFEIATVDIANIDFTTP